MRSKNSSYYRIFRLIMTVTACVLVSLGAVVVSVSAAIYRNSELEKVKSAGDFFISCITDDYNENKDDYLNAADYYGYKLASEQEIRLYMFDADGKCLIAPNGDTSNAKNLTKSTMSELEEEDFLGIDSEFLSQRVPSLMYITKFFLEEDDNKFTPRYILAAATTENVDDFNIAVLIVYSSAALLLFAGCFVIFRKRIEANMKFEAEFLRIVENYSKDEFSEKLSTDISPNLIQICDLVNTLAANVEKSEETSRTFIANVSHELRTPMTTIGGFVDGILDGTIKKSRQQEYLILVSQEIQRLRILITSMLNMSRFESGTMRPNFKETNLTDLVIKVVLMFEKRIEEKNLQVEELDSRRIIAVADADLMQQVVYNLVENAVKFVNEGGTLSFTFDKKDDICIIGIRNTGEGLKDDEIQQVFDRFYKTDSSRGKDTTGLGLGLSISRKIVHLHHGHIVVKSVYGEYTEFQIQIPEDCTRGEKEKKD
ncbi:MAG: HAMP domain-containing histidine kinase [Ruminococcus sp.]|nr:HAMP domain-containing histidine kinase [Ruminococcus sp.]